MESRNYICNYCRKEYIPKRRGVQKFCSNSCRVGSHNLEKKKSKTGLVPAPQTVKSENTKIEEMSFAGVGNVIVGTFTSELVKSIFTKEENKPATKGDLKLISSKLERFQIIKNMNPNFNGQKAYYDNEQKIIVYI
ncbi:hypothetical protein H0I29_04090 [Polaribacter sp. R2A056_3_33]|uniref:hypothetical protein n=1 Tax=Polaribacter sp. R2A056_3_33 TaxID=2745563 RepID=UPI001C4E3367|nr:hypothetical protein [Polaribacter sp. R2A056_3_33]QXP71276.1 hypothetical protein H0I29_04090 [Polaribacter sp. R2A056_3_33]